MNPPPPLPQAPQTNPRHPTTPTETVHTCTTTTTLMTQRPRQMSRSSTDTSNHTINNNTNATISRPVGVQCQTTKSSNRLRTRSAEASDRATAKYSMINKASSFYLVGRGDCSSFIAKAVGQISTSMRDECCRVQMLDGCHFLSLYLYILLEQ